MLRFGIDIGGTKINIGLIRFEAGEAQVLTVRRLEVREQQDAVNGILKAAKAVCEEQGIALSSISGCGVGIPGTVSADGRRILLAPNISCLGADFASRLETGLGMPVSMLQDSRAAAWGEYLCGAGKGADTLLCFTLGTGIGTGMVLNGNLYHGALGTAGELGHTPVIANGRPCGCGKRGCLEKYCAGGGLDITSAELLGMGNTAKDLFEAARNGNGEAQSAIDLAIERLGNVLVAAINLLSPDIVLFSGGLSEASAYFEPLVDYIRSHCYTLDRAPKIEKAALGTLAPMIGAALINA